MGSIMIHTSRAAPFPSQAQPQCGGLHQRSPSRLQRTQELGCANLNRGKSMGRVVMAIERSVECEFNIIHRFVLVTSIIPEEDNRTHPTRWPKRIWTTCMRMSIQAALLWVVLLWLYVLVRRGGVCCRIRLGQGRRRVMISFVPVRFLPSPVILMFC